MVCDFIQINPMFTSIINTDLWRHHLVLVYTRELFGQAPHLPMNPCCTVNLKLPNFCSNDCAVEEKEMSIRFAEPE